VEANVGAVAIEAIGSKWLKESSEWKPNFKASLNWNEARAE
jgi:hypothetical protein